MSTSPIATIAAEPAAGDLSEQSIRCERAASELRYGRSVLIDRNGHSLAALALDTATPEAFDRFAEAVGGRHHLYLTPPRAAVLGIDAPQGALVPLAGASFDEACERGYMEKGVAPHEWVPGDEVVAEAAALARLALLLPAIVCAEVDASDPAFADCVRIKVGDIEGARENIGQKFEIVARTPVPLADVGTCQFVVFRGGLAQRDQIAIVVGEPDTSKPVPVRVHSSCITGDLFGSLKCDCGDQLRLGLRILKERGGGVLLYLDQEGRGTGIGAKMRAYAFQNHGLDTVDADAQLGFGADERRYEAAVAMLKGLGLTRIHLVTNNPTKIAFLSVSGIEVVERIPVMGTVTPENESYLRTKARRAGHLMELSGVLGEAK